jgi:hypothetical protein
LGVVLGTVHQRVDCFHRGAVPAFSRPLIAALSGVYTPASGTRLTTARGHHLDLDINPDWAYFPAI